jgi:hypothetical protein
LLHHIGLHVDFRDTIWRLSYPDRFLVVPPGASFAPILDPQFNKNTQWTHNPMLLVSLGYAFGS